MLSDKPGQTRQGQKPSEHKSEIITPIKVRRQKSKAEPSGPRRMAVASPSFFLVVLALLIVTGFLFIRHVSKGPLNLTDSPGLTSKTEVDVSRNELTQTEQQTTLQADNEKSQSELPPDELQTSEQEQGTDLPNESLEREGAEKELVEFLKVKIPLMEKGADAWGGQPYEEMMLLSDEADALLIDNDFLAAAEKYSEAGMKASELADSSGPAFQALLEEGRKALDDGDSAAAGQKFRTALLIDPSSEPARQNLKRAENLDEVKRLLESGKNHEKNGRFAFAHTDYGEALTLDPHSSDAQESLMRVKERITGDEFQKLISDGLTAYHNGKYQSARTTLRKAKAFRPDSKEVQSALVQVNEAIRLDRIAKLRRKATTAEEAEDWEEALQSYLAVLKIDPTISFAVQGKERSLDHIRIAGGITYFLQKPGALESDTQLQNALLLMEEARTLEPRGPRLKGKLNDFIALVDAARTPIQVKIESDNLTEVAVYRVGRLGRFVTRELLLRPGTYTVVGSRDGYRDIRQEIVVKPGQNVVRATVICRDKV